MLRSSLLALSLAAAAASAQSGDATLNGTVPPTSYGSGAMKALLPVDLDGDGLTDLIGSRALRANIWRQIDDGRLTPIFPSNPKLDGLVLVADLDGDATLSLISMESASVTAREFTAPFVLGPVEPLATGFLNMTAMNAVGDLDGDGHDDLLLSSFTTVQGLLVFLGDGAGGLSTPFTAWLGSSVRSQLGDIDLDGKLDLLAGSLPGVTPLLGQGDGTFVAQPLVANTTLTRFIALGDANGDALPDAAVALGASTQILLGGGTGAFAPGANLDGVAFTVHFGDGDGDGADDELVLSSPDRVTVHALEAGASVASAGFSIANMQSASDAVLLKLGDRACVAAVNLVDQINSDVTIAACGPDGLPTLEQGFPATASAHPLATADVDGDGRKDFVAFHQPTGQVVVHQVPGDGTIGAAAPGTLVAPGEFVFGADVARLDGDAFADLVMHTESMQVTLAPWRSNGDGTFTPGTAVTRGTPFKYALGDIDGDGDDDLLFSAGVLEWHATDASGFGAAQASVIPDPPPGGQRFVLADADGDGFADLFSGSSSGYGGLVREWKGLGNGDFAAPVALAIPGHPTRDLLAADLDGDGHVDIAATGLTDSFDLGLLVLHGLGDGSFTAKSQVYPGILDDDLPARAVDFDHDGRADLLKQVIDPPRLVLLPQAADGSFGAPRGLPFEPGPALTVPLFADVDGDGVEDFLGASTFDEDTGEQPLRVSHVSVQDGALDLGHGQVGAVGVPVLTGGGTLRPTELAFIKLQAAPANVPLLLMLGLDTAYAPFKGGTLVPDPQLVLGGLVSDAQGGVELQARWPADAPPGLTVYVQLWTTDPIWGWALASNALQFEGD